MSEQQTIRMHYRATPTAAEFHASTAFVRGLMGPVGSGKSVAALWEMVMKANAQEPHNGVRRSRWAVIRNSYPELKSTTIKTWLDWFPEAAFPISWDTPITAHVRYPLAGPDGKRDGTTVELEVIFLALDKPKDVKKLLSLELTGAWINEAREVPKAVMEFLTQRVGRYPAKVAGGPTWSGIIMDTNPPDDDHWWFMTFEIEKPEGYSLFKQPGAYMGPDLLHLVPNPEAENVDNQPLGYEYWRRQIPGKTWEWVKAYVMGQYARVAEGRLVYPEYFDGRHCAKEELAIYRGMPLVLGFDFGLNPSCAFVQYSPKGQFRVIDELCGDDLGIRRFVEQAVAPRLKNVYGGMQVTAWGDPAGEQRAQTDEVTCYQILRQNGINANPCSSNDLIPRREAVARYMLREIDGEPAFHLSPKCKMLRKGFLGGYYFKRVQVMNEERYEDKPFKGPYSHIQDALQAAALGGELPVSNQMGGRVQARKVVVVRNPAFT